MQVACKAVLLWATDVSIPKSRCVLCHSCHTALAQSHFSWELGWAQGRSPTISFQNDHVCVPAGALGPVCPGPGALQVQRGEHDGIPAAERREPAGVVRGGQVVDGAAAGTTQARLGAAGRHHDSE